MSLVSVGSRCCYGQWPTKDQWKSVLVYDMLANTADAEIRVGVCVGVGMLATTACWIHLYDGDFLRDAFTAAGSAAASLGRVAARNTP